MSESVRGLFKEEVLAFQVPSVSLRWPKSPLIFHSQILWELLLALEPWAGEPCVGLGPLAPSEGTSAATVFSQSSTVTCGSGVIPFYVSTPPTGLDVSSLYL